MRAGVKETLGHLLAQEHQRESCSAIGWPISPEQHVHASWPALEPGHVTGTHGTP